MGAVISPVEREALELFYHRTGGENWTHSEGWLTAPDPCTWAGVTCERLRLTGLSLPRNGLSGTLPTEMGVLAYLKTLDLSGNQLTGRIPETLGNLRGLTALDLADNDFRGPIPPRLRLLLRLRILDLHGNALTGEIPAALHDLRALEELDLSDNRFTGKLPPELSRLGHLVRLDLSHNDLQGPMPKALTALTSLAALDFSHTGLLERPDPDFQAWLAGIGALQRTGVFYAEPVGPVSLATLAGLGTLGAALAPIILLALPVLGPLIAGALGVVGVAGAGLVAQRVYTLTRTVDVPALPAPHPTSDDALREQLLNEMRAIVRGARADLPPDSVDRLRAIEAALAEVLPRMQRLAGGDPDAYLVRQTVRAYLPEALAAYRALPRDFALTQPIRDGETAHAQLGHQLDLLVSALDDLAQRRPIDDAQRVLINSRFLEQKFPNPDNP